MIILSLSEIEANPLEPSQVVILLFLLNLMGQPQYKMMAGIQCVAIKSAIQQWEMCWRCFAHFNITIRYESKYIL